MKRFVVISIAFVVACGGSVDEPVSGDVAGGAGEGATRGASNGGAGTAAADGGAKAGGASGEGGAVALPDCHGTWPPAWVAQEEEFIAVLAAARAEGGECEGTAFPPAPPVATDPILTEVARCFAWEQALAGSAALVDGDADEAVRQRALASDFTGEPYGWDGDIVAETADDVLAGFLATPGQCEVARDAALEVGGIGYAEAPDGTPRWTALGGTVSGGG